MLVLGVDVPGYASLMVVVLLFGGLNLLSLGVIGEYLGRTYTEVKGRPLFIVDRAEGFEKAAPAARRPMIDAPPGLVAEPAPVRRKRA